MIGATDKDMVVVGIGVQTNYELFSNNGLQIIDEGIVVNCFLETNIPDVYAAGDVARYDDVLFEKSRRIEEHWDNAVAQGQYAIKNMMGQREPFIHSDEERELAPQWIQEGKKLTADQLADADQPLQERKA